MNPIHTAFPRSGEQSNGLTKREYVAIAMMAALLHNGETPETFAQIASRAVRAADALIEKLEQE